MTSQAFPKGELYLLTMEGGMRKSNECFNDLKTLYSQVDKDNNH